MKVVNKNGSIRIVKCPNCKQESLAIANMPVTIHKQCIRCGYAVFKDYEGLDENDKAIITVLDAKEPIGCVTLKYIDITDLSVLSIPTQNKYEAFLEYLASNKDIIEYCKLSTFKNDVFTEQDLMLFV